MVLSDATEIDLGALGRGRIARLIGQGGEGHVYEVQRSDGQHLALKWYRPASRTPKKLQAIRTLVEFGAPHTRFLWPLSLAHVDGENGGYVMPLRDDRFLELSHLLSERDADGGKLEVPYTATITMCRQLSFSFLRLHARGLCYRDISFGNVFFEPASGDTLICDNDNVGVDNGSGSILGTPFFMAPEIVADQDFETLPNTDTDRHSLAVLLFYILFIGHPLEGSLTEAGLRDPSWLTRHFGTDPVFCFHPDRDENRPAPNVRRYWDTYPQFLRDLFVQAFVNGIADPEQRVTEGQWIKAMDRLRDGMVSCGECGSTGFWDWAEPDRVCQRCDTSLRPPFILEIARRKIAVSRFATVRTDHVVRGIDDSLTLGKAQQHPRDSSRWGLTNMSDEKWIATDKDGRTFVVAPGNSIDLSGGLKVQVQTATVVVRLQR